MGALWFCDGCGHYSVDRLGHELDRPCSQQAVGFFAAVLPILRSGRVPYRCIPGSARLAQQECVQEGLWVEGIDTDDDVLALLLFSMGGGAFEAHNNHKRADNNEHSR